MFYEKPIYLPPKTSVANSDDFLQNLTQRFGECNKELHPWIGISLIHPSYLNENRIQGIERRMLDTLASLTVAFLEIMLFDIAHQDDTLSGMADYTQFTQAVKQNIMQLIFDDFTGWLPVHYKILIKSFGKILILK